MNSTNANYLKTGQYYSVLNTYNSIFGPNHVYVVDGKSLRNDPKAEFSLLLRHFGLNADYIDFSFDQQKGFHCLARPVHYCLRSGKGHTHKYASVYDEFPELIALKEFYSNEMLETYKYINGCETIEQCCEITTLRFKWMHEYFC